MTAPQGFALVSPSSLFEELVDKLPPLVAAKYRMLEERRDMLHGALLTAQATWQDANRELVSAQAVATAAQDGDRRDVDRFNRARQSGTPEPPSPRAAAALTALDRARDREASRRRARDESQGAFEVADRLLTAVRELLRTTDPALLVPVVVERRGPQAPREAADELEVVRASISAVTAELRAVEQAPVPPEVTAERVDARFAELAADWEPPISAFMARNYRPPGHDELLPYRLMAFFALVPEIRAAYHAAAARAYARPEAPSPVAIVAYASTLGALADRRRQAEVLEEQLVLEAAARGMAIARRAEADPVVVLTTVLAE
jgi:hypothetical protein